MRYLHDFNRDLMVFNPSESLKCLFIHYCSFEFSFFFFFTEVPTGDPKKPESNVTMSPIQKEELARIRAKNLANAVHYIWETGEDKYMLRYFHTGFWLSCEKHNEGIGDG